jgi:DNA-binding transcriptional LysR family regulator
VLREAAVAGLGLTVLPRCMVAPELAAGRLVSVLDRYPRHGEIGVYAVHPHRRHVPPKVRAVVDFLSAQFATPPWADATARR